MLKLLPRAAKRVRLKKTALTAAGGKRKFFFKKRGPLQRGARRIRKVTD